MCKCAWVLCVTVIEILYILQINTEEALARVA